MESNILNPTYKELIAIEKYRNGDTGRIYSNKHTNNWLKAIISIFAIAMLLGMMGVPIYNGIYAMESNALPYDMEITTNTGNMVTSSGSVGDIIAYEIFHWGQLPTARALAEELTGLFIDLGFGTFLSAEVIEEVSIDVATTFLADGTIDEIALDVAIDSVIYVDPVTLAAIVAPVIAS
jgi:hypothetical protein